MFSLTVVSNHEYRATNVFMVSYKGALLPYITRGEVHFFKLFLEVFLQIKTHHKRQGDTMNTLKVGDPAPDFCLTNQSGEDICISEFSGKERVLVYFYPKASTPG